MIALYCIDHVLDDRRKFRSQTSDNMERWKSRGGNSQRRESVRGKKMQVREKVKKSRNTVFPIILWLRRVDVVLCGRRKGFCTLPKLSKNVRFCSMSKNDGRRGTLEEDLERCISRGRCSTRDMFIRDVIGGQGADFLRGVAFWRIRSSGLLRRFCMTGAALRMTWHHFCVAGAELYTDGVEKSQNALIRGRQLCTQLSIFDHF